MDLKLKKVLSYPSWRQSVELGNGYSTPGHVERSLWEFIGLPANLKGKSFLDVGANDGLFSFEAEKKGATDVVSSDLYKEGVITMKEGWSKEGINLLKAYFNSGIQLHDKGIYHLTEIGRKFDVVFVNDIINWLEDIELAFKNLGEVTKETLYISDGFILDNSTPKQEKPKNMPMRFMYNLSFISALLEKNGFKIDTVRELNYQTVFFKDFTTFPIVTVSEKTKVYPTPDMSEEYSLSGAKEEKANAQHGDFYHVSKLGWVHKNDVAVRYNQPSKFYRLAKLVGMTSLYFQFLKTRHKKQSKITAYTIKAVKIK